MAGQVSQEPTPSAPTTTMGRTSQSLLFVLGAAEPALGRCLGLDGSVASAVAYAHIFGKSGGMIDMLETRPFSGIVSQQTHIIA